MLTYDQDGGAGELQYCCGTKITHNVSRMLLHMLLFVSVLSLFCFSWWFGELVSVVLFVLFLLVVW